MDAPAQLLQSLADRYAVDRLIGEGGMARVYLARDVRHDRPVALKVLNPELGAVLGIERFLSEIRVTANLQHPNLLPLFDSGEAGGLLFYVMPYVEGESLRARLQREKQLPIDDAVRIAVAVADALDYAHSHGVIHRDLKPENILLQHGQPVVADFGIALAVTKAGGNRITQTGLSLGTPQYMSPEQATGDRVIDGRSDIYSLAAVTYEMLTGEPPHIGNTSQAVIARVLTDRPRSSRLMRPAVPEHVDAALERALEKLPADRQATAREFADALSGRTQRGASTMAPMRLGASPRNRRARFYGAGALAFALGALVMLSALRTRGKPRTTWTFIAHPAKEEPDFALPYAIAPDGQSYVYSGQGEGGAQLWIKRRTNLHASPLSGTSGAVGPFFSPDSKWIAFFAGGKLKKLPVDGGMPSNITDAGSVAPWGAWLDDNRIIYGGSGYSLLQIDATGGPSRTLVTQAQLGPRGAVSPVAVPGGRGVVFSACSVNCGTFEGWVLDLRTGTSRRLLDNAYPAGFLLGHLIYFADGGLFAVPFDADKLEVGGTSIPVLDNVQSANLARNGTLLFMEGAQNVLSSRLVWVSRDGGISPVDTAWSGNFVHASLSPDGRRVAVDIAASSQQQDLWVRHLTGGTLARISFRGRVNMRPAWSPDGTVLAYVSDRDSVSALFVQRADGNGPAARLLTAAEVWEAEWSPDGQWILYRAGTPLRNYELFARRTRGDTTTIQLTSSPYFERAPTLSRDGRYFAYVSDESGRDEVYVRPFPNAGESRWLVSVEGGTEPRWAHNGRELFFVGTGNVMNVVDVSTTAAFIAGKPRRLFSTKSFLQESNNRAFDVSLDDRRFLMIQPAAQTLAVPVLVERWDLDVKARLKR